MTKRLAICIFTLLTVIVSSTVVGTSCSAHTTALGVFAAAGAKPPLDEICRKYTEQYRTKVEINYGGGGEVLNQMVLTRSGDIYVAPEQSFMETAVAKQAIEPETVRSIAFMIPVIAVPKGNPGNIACLADLAKPGVRVAVTRPETTLLGRYAPEIFQKAGLSDEIGKNIITEAARPDSLLTMLVLQEIDAGIIWHFYGVQASDDIEIVFLPPEQLTGIGEMQIAASSFSQDKEAAQELIDFITSAEGKDAFKKHGYFVDTGEVKEYWH
jgi:molybdate transport system substrate-binding protein